MCKIISLDIAADFVTDTSFQNILPIQLQKKSIVKMCKKSTGRYLKFKKL